MPKVYGPYLRKDGRLHVVLYGNGVRRTISYPKFLMEKHLGRELEPNETVDHIDNDPLNNSLDNLRILSREDNARRGVAEGEVIIVVCAVCGKEFARKRYIELKRVNQGQNGPFCSDRCRHTITHH